MKQVERSSADVAEMAWLAIRQPAIVRMLERDLSEFAGPPVAGAPTRSSIVVPRGDHDALAAGLELTAQLLEEIAQRGTLCNRVSASELVRAATDVAATGVSASVVTWTSERLARLPVVLTDEESAAVQRTVATLFHAIQA